MFSPTVLVNLGKPNAWTMEQAHYLLERNRAHDLGIAAQDLGALDANEIVGYRLDALKTLLSAQVQYDAAAGKKNSTALSQYSTDISRFNQLRDKQQQLMARQAALGGQLARAQAELSILQAQAQPDQGKIQLKNAEITQISGQKGAVDTELTSLSSAIGTEPNLSTLTSTVPAGDVTSASAIGPNSTFTQMLQGLPTSLKDSKLQASIKVDNYINLQYEIVAKQLTLLRDQAGPNNEVVFLELPQNVYVTQKLKLYPDLAAFWGSHLVQTWWSLKEALIAAPTNPHVGLNNERPPDVDEMRKILRSPDCKPSQVELALFFRNNGCQGVQHNAAPMNLQPMPRSVRDTREDSTGTGKEEWTFALLQASNPATNRDRRQANEVAPEPPHPMYALDLIPRRSALNVADAQSVSRASGFAGLVGFLSGFGAKARYERQHDQYQQFAQEEAYASAFGKGEDTFGWTFGPLPGTKRMEPGLRTTYAVLVVPKFTRVVRLQGVGCGYRRRTVPENPFVLGVASNECGQIVNFDVEIPNGDDNFFIDRVYYKPVIAGQRLTLELEGSFGTQIGVLINGTPLQKVVAIGQPMLEQSAFTVPANAGDSGISGVYESVGSKQIIASFVMPSAFVGTPRIALVTPAREAVINGYRMYVSDGDAHAGYRRLDDTDILPMFYENANIARTTPIKYDEPGRSASVLVQLAGQGFRSAGTKTFLINGDVMARKGAHDNLNPGEYRIIDSGVIQARFDRSQYFPHWKFDFLDHQSSRTIDASITYDDDGPPSLGACSYTATKDSGGKLTSLEIVIEGQFFSPIYSPVAMDKNLTISSVALLSPKSWDIMAIPGKSWLDSVIQLKGPNPLDSPQIQIRKCSDATPAPIPAQPRKRRR
ncbi:MAG: hypothetical protein ACR2NN_07885 [Bryobacteraceae bacterium]